MMMTTRYGGAVAAFRIGLARIGLARIGLARAGLARIALARIGLAGAMSLALSGCLSTAANIVTAPVRVAGKAADWATTSQSEADEKRGRDLRKREERLGKLERSYSRHRRQCDQGDDDACRTAREEYDEMQDLMPSVPAYRD